MPAPTVEEITATLPEEHSWSAAEISRAYGSERANQAKRVRYPAPTDAVPDPDWPDDLVEALALRVHNSLVSKGLPLGFQTTLSETNAATVAVREATDKIRALEAGHPRWVVR
ncbi:MAG TPA: hypothetical protein VIP28_01915 [Nocardioides sp.]